MSIQYTHKHSGISGVARRYSEPSVRACLYNTDYTVKDSNQTSDVCMNGSNLREEQTPYVYGKLRYANSPVSTLSPPHSSANSDPLSHSSVDYHYDSDSLRTENSNQSCSSQYTQSNFFSQPASEVSCYQDIQKSAPYFETPRCTAFPDPLPPYLNGPRTLSCTHVSGAHNTSSTSSDRTWLQEVETALMGPDSDDEGSPHISGEGSTSPVWTELLDEILRTNPQHVPVPVKEERPWCADFPPDYLQHVKISMPNLHNYGSSDGQRGRQVAPLEVPQSSFQFSPNLLPMMTQGHSVRKLLVMCAAAISEDNIPLAELIMGELKKEVSIKGDPIERLAAYMSEGLVARLESSGSSIYKQLKCMEAPAADVLSAMQKLYEICPYFKFVYMAANGAIAEAFKDEAKVHIFDFQIAQGAQWFSLIQALANRPEGPPSLRITTIDDPESQSFPVGGMQLVKRRLEKLAESSGVPFEFNSVPVRMSEVQANMIELRPDEALAVNFTMQLHHMPDESVCLTNPRDRLLRMVKSMNPKVVTLVEQEANTNTSPFLARFIEALDYYSAVFDSIDVALPKESKDRVNVEQQCLARDIVNIIACEGSERVERHELMGKWRVRMTMAGFTPHPLSSYVNGTIKVLLESYSKNYRLKEEGEALYLGWLSRFLVVASAWH